MSGQNCPPARMNDTVETLDVGFKSGLRPLSCSPQLSRLNRFEEVGGNLRIFFHQDEATRSDACNTWSHCCVSLFKDNANPTTSSRSSEKACSNASRASRSE